MLLASSNFLIPNGTLIFELLIFLVVFGVMAKFILPPVQRVLEERRTRIRSDVEVAEAARSNAERASAERRRILAEARSSSRTVVDQASRDAEAARDEGRRRGQGEYEARLAAAEPEIEGERRRAREGVVQALPTLVTAAAERVIGSSVDLGRHPDVIADSLREWEEAHAVAEPAEAAEATGQAGGEGEGRQDDGQDSGEGSR